MKADKIQGVRKDRRLRKPGTAQVPHQHPGLSHSRVSSGLPSRRLWICVWYPEKNVWVPRDSRVKEGFLEEVELQPDPEERT